MVMVPTQRIVRPIALLLSVAAVDLLGCSSTGGLGMLHPYTVSADDTCGKEKEALKAYRDFFFTSIVEGAAIGAAAGGLTGFLAGGDTKSTLIGAGAGAVVGGVGGYFVAKQKVASNNTQLTDSIYSDVTKENQEIDGVTRTFRALRRCRLREARDLKRDYAAHKIAQDDAQSKLKQIHDWYVEDIDFADALGAKMGDRGNEYQNAADNLETLDPTAKQKLAERKRTHPAESSEPAEETDNGSGVVALEAARVHESASTDSKQVGTLAAGAPVTLGDAANVPDGWTHVQLADGKDGYVVSRLVGPPGSAHAKSLASAPPPPKDAAGVEQLTESNQLKRKALGSEIASAQTEANGSAFELSGSISLGPKSLRWRA